MRLYRKSKFPISNSKQILNSKRLGVWKLGLGICLMLGFCLLEFNTSSSAEANPPQRIELSYNQETQILTIRVYHVSQRTRTHYIRRIVVSRNDEPVTEDLFPSQNPWGIEHQVKVETKSGDVLTVKATCSDVGMKEESLTIP